ncbi:MAG: GspE/PulE family protein [Paenibacillaceae bacterium]
MTREVLMRIGELMIMNGIINKEQLEQALKQQLIHTDIKIGELLIDNGDITERQLVEVLEFQIGVPVINMAETKFEIATVDLIPEVTARQYRIMPIEQKSGILKLAMVDPLNHETIKQIEKLTGLTVQPLLATRNEIDQAITQYYRTQQIIEDINRMIQAGVEQNAKYIHLIPEEDELVIKFQIGNKLLLQKTIPRDQQQAMIDQIKIMSGLNATDQRIPQEGRLRIQKEHEQIDLCISISILPTINGESIIMRILNYAEAKLALTDLGLSNENLHSIDQMIRLASGMIIIAGPPNSGQSSTQYAILNHLNTGEQNIISLEDPVEHRIKGITQVEVNSRIGFTYADALQYVLKRNPDIVMIDELNNKESLELTAQASLSGSLMVCGSKAPNAIQSIRRMTELGIDNRLLATTISGVIAQRLVRRVCKHCAQTIAASDEETKIFEDHNLANIDNEKNGSKSMIGNFRTYVTAQLSGKITVIRGSGCQVCNQSGYYGFVGIHEVLEIDHKLKKFIIQSLPEPELEQYLQERSYRTMLYDGLLKARQGITTVEEVLKVVQ